MSSYQCKAEEQPHHVSLDIGKTFPGSALEFCCRSTRSSLISFAFRKQFLKHQFIQWVGFPHQLPLQGNRLQRFQLNPRNLLQMYLNPKLSPATKSLNKNLIPSFANLKPIPIHLAQNTIAYHGTPHQNPIRPPLTKPLPKMILPNPSLFNSFPQPCPAALLSTLPFIANLSVANSITCIDMVPPEIVANHGQTSGFA